MRHLKLTYNLLVALIAIAGFQDAHKMSSLKNRRCNRKLKLN